MMWGAVLRTGVGGSLLIWVAMCMIDPVAVGQLGTVDLPWRGDTVIFGDRAAWVIGQLGIVFLLLWLAVLSDLAVWCAVISAGLLAAMAYLIQEPRPVFWGLGTIEQAFYQLMLLGWLLLQRQRSDRLAAGALFIASLVGLALMADAQARMNGIEITAGDPALAFSVAYGEWSAPVIPFIGILLLAACAAFARRDPTWTPTTPGG